MIQITGHWHLQLGHVHWLYDQYCSQLGCTVAYMCRCPTSPAEASLGQLRVTGWQTEWNQGSRGPRENVCAHGLYVGPQWTHPSYLWLAYKIDFTLYGNILGHGSTWLWTDTIKNVWCPPTYNLDLLCLEKWWLTTWFCTTSGGKKVNMFL